MYAQYHALRKAQYHFSGILVEYTNFESWEYMTQSQIQGNLQNHWPVLFKSIKIMKDERRQGMPQMSGD